MDSYTANDFAKSYIEKGTSVYTDSSPIYNWLPYTHDSVNHSAKQWKHGDVHTNGVESVWEVLKRVINSTWHHVSPKHLHRYTNETAFRLNIGNCEIDTEDRMKALVRGIDDKRIAYKDLIA